MTRRKRYRRSKQKHRPGPRLSKRLHLIEPLEPRHLLAAVPFGTNPLQANDVTRDGQVSALDALRVINALNDTDDGIADPAKSLGNFIDVTGNGVATARDALRVINALNNEAPILAATLPNDSGPADRTDLALDLLTNDYGVDLHISVGDLSDEAVEMKIGDASTFTDITNQFTGNEASLTPQEVDTIFGGPLPDGDHDITVRIPGGSSINFVLTVDRAAPTPQPTVGDLVRVAPERLDVSFGEPIATTEVAPTANSPVSRLIPTETQATLDSMS